MTGFKKAMIVFLFRGMPEPWELLSFSGRNWLSDRFFDISANWKEARSGKRSRPCPAVVTAGNRPPAVFAVFLLTTECSRIKYHKLIPDLDRVTFNASRIWRQKGGRVRDVPSTHAHLGKQTRTNISTKPKGPKTRPVMNFPTLLLTYRIIPCRELNPPFSGTVSGKGPQELSPRSLE